MFSTQGINHVATITELRTNANDLLDFANASDEGILIARNNEPQGVLIGVEQYQRFIAFLEEAKAGRKNHCHKEGWS
jgi:prevent-host-death family protein